MEEHASATSVVFWSNTNFTKSGENLRTSVTVELTRLMFIIMICKSRFMEVFRLPQDISLCFECVILHIEIFTVFSCLWSCRLSVWHRPTKAKSFFTSDCAVRMVAGSNPVQIILFILLLKNSQWLLFLLINYNLIILSLLSRVYILDFIHTHTHTHINLMKRKFKNDQKHSESGFRSLDLWVMSPTRCRCANSLPFYFFTC